MPLCILVKISIWGLCSTLLYWQLCDHTFFSLAVFVPPFSFFHPAFLLPSAENMKYLSGHLVLKPRFNIIMLPSFRDNSLQCRAKQVSCRDSFHVVRGRKSINIFCQKTLQYGLSDCSLWYQTDLKFTFQTHKCDFEKLKHCRGRRLFDVYLCV